MSWSIDLIGTPENIVKALEAESAALSDESKVEFDDAKPHLIGLVAQNFAAASYSPAPIVRLQASGSGYGINGEHVSRTCAVTIGVHYGKLV